MKRIYISVLSFFTAAFLLAGCATTNTVAEFFMPDVSTDKGLANSLKEQIAGTPAEYPLMSRASNPAAYKQVDRIFTTILDCGEIKNRDTFDWEISIIDTDVLNAFACPGGKVYVYSGLIKYLDNEAQLAGVIAHEIGHADKRHSVRQMTKNNGLSTMTEMILGKNTPELVKLVGQTATNIGGLAFSREDEYEADALAVKYLGKVGYDPLEVGGFFKKMMSDEKTSQEIIEFLSTHPASKNRVARIEEEWKKNGSIVGQKYEERYRELKSSL